MSPPLPVRRCDVSPDDCPHGHKLDKIERDVADIRAAILGDIRNPDRPGLAGRIGDAEQAIEDLRAADRERAESRKFLSTTTVGAAITSVVGAIVAAITAAIAWMASKGHG